MRRASRNRLEKRFLTVTSFDEFTLARVWACNFVTQLMHIKFPVSYFPVSNLEKSANSF